MADRNTKVTLTAQVSQYVAGMEKAARKTKDLGSEAEKLAAKKEAFTELGQASLAVGTMAAVGVALAVSKFSDFDSAMSNVKAATQETASNMTLLRDAALDAGADTVYSASEAANAIEELGKAGLSTSDILNGGLDGALSLAAAGGIGVAEAAGYAATALKQFKLEGDDMTHVADLLAAGAGKAMGDVSDLSSALGQAGMVAASTGLSIEETTGTLAAFASQGLLGSDAGTSFKAMLQRLTPQSAEAAARMKELGISAYDAQGNFIGMEKFAGNLETSLAGLTTEQRNSALATIFGSDAVRAATVLYTEGADGIAKWNDEVNDSGYAAKVAADRLDNLKGDVEKLGGSFDTYLIKSGSGANDVLRALVQGATGVTDAFGSLPAPVLGVGLALGGLVAVIGLAGGAALIAVPKVAQFKIALTTLGVSGATAARGIGLASGALGIATIAFALWAGRQAEATAVTAEFKESLDQATGATTSYTRELISKKLAESGAFDAAKEAGISQKELTDAVLEGGDALDGVNRKINGNNTIVDFFSGVGIRAGNARDTIKTLADGLDRSEQEFKDQKAAAEGSAEGTDEATESYVELEETVDGVVTSLQDLAKEIDAANGKNLDAREAARQLESAYDDFDAALKENGKTLDITTDKGRANQEALDAIAEAALVAGQSIVDSGGSYEDYQASLESSREALLIRINDLGITGNEAEALADSILSIPSETQFAVWADTADAEARLQRINNLIDGINTKSGEHVATTWGGGLTMADGGAVTGVGGPRQDNIPIRGSVGEHMLDAEDVLRMGGQAGVYRFRQSLYMADGGAVGYRSNALYGSHSGSSTVTSTRGDTNVSAPISIIGDLNPELTATKVQNRINKRARGL